MLTNIAETKAKPSRKAHRVLPGFRLTLGFTLVYLSLIVLIPLSTIVLQSFQMSGSDFLALITDKRIISAFKISLLTSLSAALFNVALGVLTAWVLVRYSFPGKTFINGLIDLPFALPTAVAGISLTAIYSQNGWIGQIFYAVGIPSAYSAVGITIALVFIGLPFIVRTVQPVLEEWDTETEEAAAILGAYRLRTFVFIILPQLIPAILTGFTLAFARGIGEYGSVIFISGNMPFKTEIAPLLMMTKLEQFDYPGATAIALMMLLISFLLLFIMNLIQWRYARRWGS
ncbi:sulfate ABC transporter permease subunit CysT [Paenibacillus aquistagni]|uniref:Sulfate transport system permease protein CysT n=1 Tax=Paenibacillus aquistagni TaxID=1852522 RepID=A0A1X7LKS8_9BACL|nr:sulfate ABC transporter permease subunit CysT [Paenibacillus aquistagni]SMG54461.1 sulfate transport system permease protein [Paenibacillus aquistagni]